MLALAASAPHNPHMEGESKDVRLPVMIGKDDAASQCWHLADCISTKAAAVHHLIGKTSKAKPLLADMYVWLDGSGGVSEEIANALERLRESRLLTEAPLRRGAARNVAGDAAGSAPAPRAAASHEPSPRKPA